MDQIKSQMGAYAAFSQRSTDYSQARRNYFEYRTVLPDWIGNLALLLGFTLLLLGDGWFETSGWVIVVLFAYRAGARSGGLEGYLLGFNDGRDQGGREALGLTLEDARSVQEAMGDIETHELFSRSEGR